MKALEESARPVHHSRHPLDSLVRPCCRVAPGHRLLAARYFLFQGSPLLVARIAVCVLRPTALHLLTLSTTLRHFFPLCALIVDSFTNMSSGIVLEMEKFSGFLERREKFLWCVQCKPQLLAVTQVETHSASRSVAEKNLKMFCNS
jgi:hypothetical protein